MDLTKLLPLIDQIVKKSLTEKVYSFGKSGMGRSDKVSSGRLKNSIKSKIVPEENGIQVIQFEAFGRPLENTYAYFLIYGRKSGKRPPIKDIEQWIRNSKDFKIKDFKTGQTLPKNEKNIKKTAFIISRSIGRFGFKSKGENFIDISFDDLMKDPKVVEIVGDAAFDDLLKELEKI